MGPLGDYRQASAQVLLKRMRLRQRLIMRACGHGGASCHALLGFPSQPLFHNSGPCDAGRYGTEGQTSSTCTGTCSAGYACLAGSTSATQVICPAGQFSLAGAALCSPCNLGAYGASDGQTAASCTGLCPAGRRPEVPRWWLHSWQCRIRLACAVAVL